MDDVGPSTTGGVSMRSLRIAAVLSILAVGLAAQNTAAGQWRAVFVNPNDPNNPKMFTEVILDLKVDGTTLTGTADMPVWPGLAPIADGKIDGNQFSFTWTGLRPFYANGREGYPSMTFTGAIDGNSMKLTMVEGGDLKREMKAERLPRR
jgi:hypothetical protein